MESLLDNQVTICNMQLRCVYLCTKGCKDYFVKVALLSYLEDQIILKRIGRRMDFKCCDLVAARLQQ